MPSTKRDQLIDTALDLFSRDGFQATGIDRILAESGVAKMTLYNHFKSKDELILASCGGATKPSATGSCASWSAAHRRRVSGY